MNHWIAAPVLLPLVAGGVLLVLEGTALATKRAISVVATAALIPLTLHLMSIAGGGEHQVYYLGDWPAPFGIVLVLDRLSALMLLLASVLATASLVYAVCGDDSRGEDTGRDRGRARQLVETALHEYEALGDEAAPLRERAQSWLRGHPSPPSPLHQVRPSPK